MTEPTQHIHWAIQAFESVLESGMLTDAVEINVVADNETQAVKRAKELVKRKNYRVAKVTDSCTFEDYYKDLSIEIQKRTYKLMKKVI